MTEPADVPVRRIVARIAVTRSMLDEVADAAARTRQTLGDFRFALVVGRSKVNPNPMPRIRLVRWLP